MRIIDLFALQIFAKKSGRCNFRLLQHYLPRAEVGDLFDYLVGQQLERGRHGEAEGAGGLEVNDQLVFERELNGQIARICASQNLINIGRGRSRLLQLIDTI
jgi:hypothetical protein